MDKLKFPGNIEMRLISYICKLYWYDLRVKACEQNRMLNFTTATINKHLKYNLIFFFYNRRQASHLRVCQVTNRYEGVLVTITY